MLMQKSRVLGMKLLALLCTGHLLHAPPQLGTALYLLFLEGAFIDEDI
jgi:hypothetical protein